MSTVLVKGGTVLSLDRGVGNHQAADVLIEDGVIREVGPGLRARHAEVVDASQAIVMPGFVDGHRHAWHKCAPINPAVAGPHFTPDHLYAATLAGLLGAVEAGITTVVDWSDLAVDSSSAEAALQAHHDAGTRAVFAAPGALSDTLTAPANVTLALGSDDPSAWPAARDAGLRIHAHAGDDPGAPSITAAPLGEDVTLVHCTNLDEAGFDAVAAAGARVVLCPAMEMTAGIGWPPLQPLIDRGIRPGLGVGSELEAPGDLFAQMRAANSVQHATLFEHKLAGKGGVPNLLTTRDVIRYATVDGAAAAGLGDVTGSLAPGKQADLVVLRTDRPNIAPVNDPIGAVVWGMDTSNVDWVLAGGRALVRHGALAADVARARELATAAQREVAAAAGLLAEADAGARQP